MIMTSALYRVVTGYPLKLLHFHSLPPTRIFPPYTSARERILFATVPLVVLILLSASTTNFHILI